MLSRTILALAPHEQTENAQSIVHSASSGLAGEFLAMLISHMLRAYHDLFAKIVLFFWQKLCQEAVIHSNGDVDPILCPVEGHIWVPVVVGNLAGHYCIQKHKVVAATGKVYSPTGFVRAREPVAWLLPKPEEVVVRPPLLLSSEER